MKFAQMYTTNPFKQISYICRICQISAENMVRFQLLLNFLIGLHDSDCTYKVVINGLRNKDSNCGHISSHEPTVRAAPCRSSYWNVHIFHPSKSWDELTPTLCQNKLPNILLVGGWTNPFEKYESKWESFPQIGMKRQNIWNHHLANILPLIAKWIPSLWCFKAKAKQ